MNKILIPIVAIAMIAFSLGLTVNSLPKQGTSHVSALYETAVCVYKNGVLIGECTHNTIPNAGLNWTADKLFGTATIGGTPTVLALGNNSNAESATILTINTTANENAPIPGCGLAPVTISGANLTRLGSSNANVSLSYVFVSSCNGIVVNTTALYNSTTMSGFGTSTIMFAGKNFSNSVTLQSGDQLNVTWYVWLTSS